MLMTGAWNVNIWNHMEEIVVWAVRPGKQQMKQQNNLSVSANSIMFVIANTIFKYAWTSTDKSTEKSNWLYHCHKRVEEVSCNNKIVAGGWLWNRLWIAYVQVPSQAKADKQPIHVQNVWNMFPPFKRETLGITLKSWTPLIENQRNCGVKFKKLLQMNAFPLKMKTDLDTEISKYKRDVNKQLILKIFPTYKNL